MFRELLDSQDTVTMTSLAPKASELLRQYNTKLWGGFDLTTHALPGKKRLGLERRGST